VTTRLAINELRSAGRPGALDRQWLPEPIITGGQAETACSLSLAVLVLLEKRSAGQ
jgi:hypothetical protein